MTAAGGEIVRQAVILAGGRGTRLGAIAAATPKPLLPVNGRPFLHLLLDQLALAGMEEIIVSIGHLGGAFDAALSAGRWTTPEGDAVRVTTSHEAEALGTGGALTLLRGRLDPRFMLLNGDSLLDCDLIAVARAAEALPAGHALLTTRAVPDTARYGRVETAADGNVTGFREKSVAGPGQISAGISVLPAGVTDYITALPCSIETDIYPALAAEGRLHSLPVRGFFIDIGLPETYAQAQTALPAALRRPTVFFDRDGTLNRDEGYTHDPAALALLPGAARAVALARARGYRTVVVTNQGGIGKGLFAEHQMRAFHRALNRALRDEAGGWIDAFVHCPFHPDATDPALRHADHPDRKPNAGMIRRAAAALDLDLAGSVLIGDADSDMAAAAAAGVRGLRATEADLEGLLADLPDRSE